MPDLKTLPANGIEIAYETFGERGAPPIVLVMGLGTQMLAWPDELCEDLAQRGHHVVRFDNRDVGASTHFTGIRAPSIAALLSRRARPPYTIDDMADDCLALIDALDLAPVHLVGASLGGFIAQTAALRRQSSLRSLTLIMTSTGSRRVGQAAPRLISRLLQRPVVTDREAAMRSIIDTFTVIGSKGYALDEERLRDVAGRSFERGYDPGGYRRQLAAVIAQPNRTERLREIRVPTLVMHGLHDPLVAPSGGLALARRIRGSRFVGFNGMGHDLPRELWPEFADHISALVRRAER
ncbi:MAG: alpha/beta hydrolase fold protein [Frankiales bacterium]|nr:alpha/beta hydrolase fold protein [Frankiales bacterium]